MKKIILALILIAAYGQAMAAAKVLPSVSNQSPQVVGGKDPNGNIVPFSVDASGNSITIESFGTISAKRITISANGATDRTQGTTLTSNSCTFLAIKANGSANTGVVYAGGSTVTNASGANPGFPLSAGSGLGPISMSNLNQIYFAADTANDGVAAFCN